MSSQEVHVFAMPEAYDAPGIAVPSVVEIFKTHETAYKIARALGNETVEVTKAVADGTAAWIDQRAEWQQAAVGDKTHSRDNRAAERRGHEPALKTEPKDGEETKKSAPDNYKKLIIEAARPVLARSVAIQEGIFDWEDELLDTRRAAQEAIWEAHEAEAVEDITAAETAAEAEVAAFNTTTEAEAPRINIGKWVIGTNRNWRERTRDSIGTPEQRAEIKKAEWAAARAERKKLARKGQRRPRSAPDGYVPGTTPEKHDPWNMTVAQNVLLEEHDLVLESRNGLVSADSSQQESLLNEEQAQTIYKAWDAHEAEVNAVATQAIAEMFTRRAEREIQERMDAYSVGKGEAVIFDRAKNNGRVEGEQSATLTEPNVVKLREREALKAARNYENRVTRDTYDSAGTSDQEDLAVAA